MKMKKGSSAKSNDLGARGKLVYVKSSGEIPDFKSEDEIAAWYQTHSTVLIQDQLETLPARVGGKLRARLADRSGKRNALPRGQRRTRSAQSN
jgi:hypothetical protein